MARAYCAITPGALCRKIPAAGSATGSRCPTRNCPSRSGSGAAGCHGPACTGSPGRYALPGNATTTAAASSNTTLPMAKAGTMTAMKMMNRVMVAARLACPRIWLSTRRVHRLEHDRGQRRPQHRRGERPHDRQQRDGDQRQEQQEPAAFDTAAGSGGRGRGAGGVHGWRFKARAGARQCGRGEDADAPHQATQRR